VSTSFQARGSKQLKILRLLAQESARANCLMAHALKNCVVAVSAIKRLRKSRRIAMNFSVMTRVWGCVVSVALVGVAAAGPQKESYHLLRTYNFGAAEGSNFEYFDYIAVDSSARRVYLSHGSEVKVIDADTGKLIGNVTGLKLDHGVALAPEFGRGFISDGLEGKLVVFDLNTLKVTGEVSTAPDADCVLYDPATKRVFSMNGESQSATVVDAKSANVLATIDLSGSPEFAVSGGIGTVYGNIADKNEIVAIDSRSLIIKSRWPVAPAGGPTALAIDRQHRRLFSAGRNPQILVVLDADSGKIIQSFPISAGVDAAAYDAETGMIFASTREGMVHVFHEDSPDRFSVVETIKTQVGAKTMALDAKTHNLFLDTADFAPPPPPTSERPHPRPQAVLGTFRVLVYGR
jgi:YVTN family beta-propeller protein